MKNRPLKKKNYLDQPEHPTHQLSVKNLDKIIAYYQDKYQIKIFLNGSLSKEKIKERIDSIQTKIDTFTQSNIKYFHYLEAHLTDEKSFSKIFANFTESKDLYIELQKFLTENNVFRKDLTEEEKIFINRICEEKFKDIFDILIKKYFKQLAILKSNCGLTQAEVNDEIRKIQSNLKNDEAFGYIYTNGLIEGSTHFEVLILTKDKVIKPVSWYLRNNQEFESSYMYHTPATIIKTTGHTPAPQADATSCGTLGLKYLKELLKNQAKGLGQSLTFDYQNTEGEIVHFFLPSPEVLRYSQSNLYIQLMRALVAGDNNPENNYIEIKHNGKSYKVTKLETLLQHSLAYSEQLRHRFIDVKTMECIQSNTQDKLMLAHYDQNIEAVHRLLKSLSEFRQKWLQRFDAIEQQRNEMDSHHGRNLYLAYSTVKMMEIVANTSDQPKIHSTASNNDQDTFFTSSQSTPQQSDVVKEPYIDLNFNLESHNEDDEESDDEYIKSDEASENNDNNEVKIETPDYKKTLTEILDMLNDHQKYIIKGIGKVKKYINEEGRKEKEDKRMTASAYRLASQLEVILKNKQDITEAEFEKIANNIELELFNKTKATRGSLFFGLGKRDITTAILYKNIIDKLNAIKPVKNSPTLINKN